MHRTMGQRWQIRHHGQPVSPVLISEDASFLWLLRHQPNSVSHAIHHEGYRIIRKPDVPVTQLQASELKVGDRIRTAGVEARIDRVQAHAQIPAQLVVHSADFARTNGFICLRADATVSIVDRKVQP